MEHKIPNHVNAFIDSVVSLDLAPIEIWLIGSRANGSSRYDSDTDLLIFGSEQLADNLKKQLIPPERIDCLVIYNGNDYKVPWKDKSGSLTELKWARVDENRAKYIGKKWVPDLESSLEFCANMGELVEHQEISLRLWP